MINVLLRDRHFDQALKLSKEVLQEFPKFAESHYLYGLSALSLNQLDASIQACEKAVELEKSIPHYYCNLGEAYRRSDKFDLAILSFESALKIKPDYEIARYNLGSALFANKKYQQALKTFQKLVTDYPDNANYWVVQSDAHRELGRIKQAILSYQHALRCDLNNFAGHYNLGFLLLHKAEYALALEHCKMAVTLKPQNGFAHQNLGQCYIGLEELNDAMNAFADALELLPDSVSLMTHIAQVWSDIADYHQAATWFGKALKIEPDNIKAQIGLAVIKRENELTEAALEDLILLNEKHPDNSSILSELGQTAWDNGDAADAVSYFRQNQILVPESPQIYVRIGGILSSSGDVEGAVAEYNKALDQNPSFIPALNGLATTLRAKLESDKVELLLSLSTNSLLPEGAQASLHNSLAYYYDGVKEFDKVPQHAAESNRLYWASRSKKGWEYDPSQYETHIDKLIEVFDERYFERVKGFGSGDQTPVFIVGMPRSGTTLTEQILSTHENVLGIGERTFASRSFVELPMVMGKASDALSLLPNISKDAVSEIAENYLKRLEHQKEKNNTQLAVRVVDKMPDNYSQIGWILTLFPNAKIIHCRRDVRDVALSCWLTQFGAIRWASDLEHIAARIKQYQRIMEHWRKILPGRILELDYEKLVENQEQESRRLFDWIGVDWDDKCLAFYQSDRLVRTASVTQVRQPIYKRSVARWKSYEKMLEPIIRSQDLSFTFSSR